MVLKIDVHKDHHCVIWFISHLKHKDLCILRLMYLQKRGLKSSSLLLWLSILSLIKSYLIGNWYLFCSLIIELVYIFRAILHSPYLLSRVRCILSKSTYILLAPTWLIVYIKSFLIHRTLIKKFGFSLQLFCPLNRYSMAIYSESIHDDKTRIISKLKIVII